MQNPSVLTYMSRWRYASHELNNWDHNCELLTIFDKIDICTLVILFRQMEIVFKKFSEEQMLLL